jgi:hypothetical protein
MAMQIYQDRCRIHCLEPRADFLDAIACGASAYTVNNVSTAHLEAMATVFPSTAFRSLTLQQTKLSCSSWTVLMNSVGNTSLRTLSLQNCDLAALKDAKSFAKDVAQLRVAQLGMFLRSHWSCISSSLRV